MRCTNKAMLKINTRDRTRNINYRPIKTESSSVYILRKSLPPRFYSFLFPSFFFRFPSQFSFSVQSVCIACGKISWFSFHCTAKDWNGGKKNPREMSRERGNLYSRNVSKFQLSKGRIFFTSEEILAQLSDLVHENVTDRNEFLALIFSGFTPSQSHISIPTIPYISFFWEVISHIYG